MRIVFMGTTDFAVPILFGLADRYEVVQVVTQPDRPVGRHRRPKQSSVKICATSLNIPLFQPESIKRDFEPILAAQPDMIVVCAYGQMIPDRVLFFPRFRSLNVHASLLPKYRGGAPMQRSLMAGDTETGVTVMYMETKMDSGPLLAQARCPILPEDDIQTLEGKLSVLGRNLLLETIPLVVAGKIIPQPQDESQVTFAYNVKPHEERLDFSLAAEMIKNKIRALSPNPGTYVMLGERKLKLLKVETLPEPELIGAVPGEVVIADRDKVHVKTGSGLINIHKVQLEGRNAMDIGAFMNGLGRDLLAVGRKFT